MRTLLFILSAGLLAAACGPQTENTETTETAGSSEQMAMNYYGDTITTDGAIAIGELKSKLTGQDSLAVKVEGTINATCKMKGCWMTMDMGNGEEMRVRFKDYGFFVPTEGASGKTAVIEGFAFADTITVAQLQHDAEDAQKSAEEIAAITTPEIGVNFEATGVIIKD